MDNSWIDCSRMSLEYDGHPKAFRKLLEQAEKLMFLEFTKFTKLLW